MIMLFSPEENDYHVHHVFVCTAITMLVELGVVSMCNGGLLCVD